MTSTPPQIETFMLHDDGTYPGNALPVVLYRHVIHAGHHEPGQVFVERFEQSGWDNIWRNGIFDFRHYHATTHEVLGCARGWVRVELGGPGGREVELRAGDVVVLPAGTAHMNAGHSPDYLIVGAYPPDHSADMCYGSVDDHHAALQVIARVPLPHTDPVYGSTGPLLDAWSPQRDRSQTDV